MTSTDTLAGRLIATLQQSRREVFGPPEQPDMARTLAREGRPVANYCPFCKRIKAGEYGEHNQHVVSFEPLNPVTPGHLLVVPREHVMDATVRPFVSALTMSFAAELAYDRAPCNLITSVGALATQGVYHLHLHLVPRRDGDGLHLPWTGQRALTGGDSSDER